MERYLLVLLALAIAAVVAVVILSNPPKVVHVPSPQQKCAAWVMAEHPENPKPAETCRTMARLDPDTFRKVYGR